MLLFETQTSEIMSPTFAIILFLFSQEKESIHQSPITKNKVKEMAGATATRVIIWDTFFKSKSK